MRFIGMVGLASVSLISSGSCASLSPLQFVLFHANGSANVYISSINDNGTAVGDLWADSAARESGFIGKSGKVQILQSPNDGPPHQASTYPTSINDAGYVAGTYIAGDSRGFVWKSGRFISDFDLGYQVLPLPGPTLGSGAVLSYNYALSSGLSWIFAGRLGALHQVNVGGFGVVFGTNSSGDIAGQFPNMRGPIPVSAVFVAGNMGVQELMPEGAVASYGGYINPNGEVAGSYLGIDATPGGFLYSHGRIETFDLPAGATSLVVQGLNANHTVFGTFVSKTYRYGFLYQAGKFLTFGGWPVSDKITISGSTNGNWLAVAIQQQASSKSESLIARCSC